MARAVAKDETGSPAGRTVRAAALRDEEQCPARVRRSERREHAAPPPSLDEKRQLLDVLRAMPRGERQRLHAYAETGTFHRLPYITLDGL